MEGILALGTPYVLCLTAVLLLLIIYSTRQKALEKRLDALVQMSRISGEVQGVEEISGPLAFARSTGGLRRWGIILTMAAIGLGIAGMFSGHAPLVTVAIIAAALGLGLYLAAVWPAKSVVDADAAAN
ncbi:MAG: hypothetical protein HOM67_00225 [Halieaceae bacterium]|jgi:hypothetical protein|nr:hypothetical protein [Halieaceae bacterium]MBT5134225.1 hypothetical protein [Halieaceae bacterium]MBT5556534.1 hypothetical protein [Halieaceae bacterium]